jgi:phospholipid/cholesterol/gamma-HCH transport system ATP-binding protein
MEVIQKIQSPQLKSQTAEPVIEIKDLCKSFGNNIVLNHFDLTLNKGESVAVLGKSGSGKSVLIKCIIGLLKPEKGSVSVFEKNIPELNHDELDKIRVKVGFLFQSNALYDSMTVRENLQFPLRRHSIKLDKKEEETLLKEALENVGLYHTIEMMPVELSGGMRKRIALARTLILKPDIILYDEPTTGLDSITGGEISDLMVEVQEKYNTSSLIISHDMKCIRKTADRIIILMDGKAYADGTYEELKLTTDPRVKQFFQ